MNEKKSRFYIMHALVAVVLLIVIGISLTYAYVSGDVTNNYGTYTVSSSAPCVALSYSESEVINLTKQYPLTDAQGAASDPVTITIKNNCPNEVNYSLFITSLTKTGISFMEDGKVKIKVDGSTTIGTRLLSSLNSKTSGTSYTQINQSLANRATVKTYSPRTSYYITSNTTPTKIASGVTHTYNVRLWIDFYEGGTSSNAQGNTTQGKSFAAAFTLVSPGVD